MSDTNHEAPESARFTAAVPAGDHPVAADHLATSAVATLSTELQDIVGVVAVHQDMAPASSKRVLELTSIVAGETLAWIRRWPV